LGPPLTRQLPLNDASRSAGGSEISELNVQHAGFVDEGAAELGNTGGK
jgi:hypothetical protein